MARVYAKADYSRGMCDVCGFDYLLKTLKYVFVMGRNTNIKACEDCWDADHPQNFLPQAIRRHGADPQAVKEPRPDAEAVGYSLFVTPGSALHGTSLALVVTGVFPGYSIGVTSFSGSGIAVNSKTMLSPTRVLANVSISSGAALGQQILTIVDANGNSLKGVFTVS